MMSITRSRLTPLCGEYVKRRLTGSGTLLALLLACSNASQQSGHEVAVSTTNESEAMTMPTDPSIDVAGLPDSGPRWLCAVEHSEDGQRLLAIDLKSGKDTSVYSGDLIPESCAFSPGGHHVAYVIGRTASVVLVDSGEVVRVIDNVNGDAIRPFRFSPDGKWLAVSHGPTVSVTILDAEPPTAQKFDSTRETVVRDLLWSPDSRLLVALASGRTPDQGALLAAEAPFRSRTVAPGRRAIQLLAWRDDNGEIILTRSREEDGLEEVIAWKPDGIGRRLMSEEAPVEGWSAVGYLSHSNRVVMRSLLEDTGTPSALETFALPDGPGDPWLTEHEWLTDFSLSNDGRWAVFADRSTAGDSGWEAGDIHLVDTESGKTWPLIRAEPGEVVYSAPALGL